jgi:hypothetical protein
MIPPTSFAHSAVNASMAFETKIRELLDAIVKDLEGLGPIFTFEWVLNGNLEPSGNDWDMINEITQDVSRIRDICDTMIETDYAYVHRKLPAEMQERLEDLGTEAATHIKTCTASMAEVLAALTIKGGGGVTRETIARIRDNGKAAEAEAAQLEQFKGLVTKARECGIVP